MSSEAPILEICGGVCGNVRSIGVVHQRQLLGIEVLELSCRYKERVVKIRNSLHIV